MTGARVPGAAGTDPDELLAEAGRRLASALVAAIPDWVHDQVARLVAAWEAAGGTLAVDGGVPGVMSRADQAGEQAAAELAGPLGELLAADVDAQRTTPLALVRRLVVFPTAVLAEAGVPPVERDRYAEARFPDDPYDLVPGSLGAVAPELDELSMVWGAAKAAAHRWRHGEARPDRPQAVPPPVPPPKPPPAGAVGNG